jgi:predicted phosphodiesterase
MKYLILSDIHGNLEALKSVLQELESKSIEFDGCIILGDLVGYGADPNKVAKQIREMKPAASVRGNHDKAAAGLSDARDFNYAARNAALWTRKQLSAQNKEYIAKLPEGPVEVDKLFHIVHGSPWDEDYYIFNWREALFAFQRSDKQFIFFGHTHIPVIWSLDKDDLTGEGIPDEHYEQSLDGGNRYLINPGSVGQPRDRNPRASMAVLDTGEMKIQFFRVEYDVKKAQEKIRKAGLDGYLADRLAVGM